MSTRIGRWSCAAPAAAAALALAATAGTLAGQATTTTITTTTTPAPAAPKTFYACYGALTGTVYRIKEQGLPQQCYHASHVEFSWTDGQAQGALKNGDPAGGDLGGTYPDPLVSRLRGTALSATAPASGQVLTFDGTSWAPAAPPAGVTNHGALTGLANDDHPQYLRADGTRALTGALSAGGFKLTGLGAATATGDAVPYEQAVKTGDAAAGDLAGAYPGPTVTGLQGRAVSATAPASGQVLTFNGTSWAPATPPAAASGTSANTPNALVQRDASGGFAAGALTLSGKFDQTSDAGLVARGTLLSGVIPATGPGVRLMWYPRKAAFRAGQSGGAAWDDANVGENSTAMGHSTTASGQASTAMGGGTTASGDNSTAMGAGARASGQTSTAMGLGTTASGDNSTAMGGATTASGQYSTAMGLFTTASGAHSTAMGVRTTASGERSTAMGAFASTNGHQGAFVYGDASTSGTGTEMIAAAANEFVVRAAGGFRLRTSADLSTGCNLPAGSGAWECTSSRHLKTGFAPVDGGDLLRRIEAVPVTTWRYRAEDPSVRHLGPTAQDFRAAFGLGTGDSSIGLLDISGVTFAGVQALERRTRALAEENDALRAELAKVRQAYADVVRRVERLEQGSQGRGTP